jgi:hypothetical protein
MAKKLKQKNPMLQTFCRQCHTALAAKAQTCPLCGLSRPNYDELNALEKEYLQNAPTVPVKFCSMCETIDPTRSLAANIVKELKSYLVNFGQSYLLIVSLIAIACGGALLLAKLAFPLSFMLFWAGMVYTGFDAVNFFRAVMVSFLVRRLQMKSGLSPYSVHFKIENQLIQMLQSLQMVINSFFDKDWSNPANDKSTAQSFINAAQTLTRRIRKYAQLSLETSAIIWRNNVYALVAMSGTYQEKANEIGNKIREAEAMILRYRWLMRFGQIETMLENHLASPVIERNGPTPRQKVIDTFYLSPHGPMTEPYAGNFQHVPHEIPFKMRFFWHQQLPPFPLSGEEILEECPAARDLFDSIQQVRQLKSRLEEQMILECTSNAIADIPEGATAVSEAGEIQRQQVYLQFLDIPRFQPDTEDLDEQLDKLRARIRVEE